MATSKKSKPVSVAQINEWKRKAEKWDQLEEKIHNCYFNEDGSEKDVDDGTDLVQLAKFAPHSWAICKKSLAL